MAESAGADGGVATGGCSSCIYGLYWRVLRPNDETFALVALPCLLVRAQCACCCALDFGWYVLLRSEAGEAALPRQTRN